ncbi:ATP-dependent transcriptional regulator, MalT-like, LuxR family [Beutenbergia cavernae DSM 12333]|uniref:ATP-dependent transcriptional regulator, MalT-like, LuxR family n=1 Tax=Beutenbergia cavernae (strain ATCC BAA-8 / DSM 12333 / CCUG 43141 / JCM 11478 / NBRC 16432 / NCIMB 13614 / HKI 0122) TaxID=471853 RepID=C5BYR9_BEUC1|nr:LuxR C-terminal-related transcriptional regulator [Beutenbergia cavernae]ACQ79027.1 ATP-dependent transcriptional regulator, MalT-like, LuxR family [Beutenbergia cavernae DSM 12333]
MRGGTAIDRPRLGAALDDAVTRAPVTLVSAPAGYGKTTLVRGWAVGRAGVAWLDVDASVARPLALFRAVASSVAGQVEPDAAGRLSQLARDAAREGSVPWADLLDGLVAALDDTCDPVVLVLDDAHRLGLDEPNVLAHLVRIRHPALRLVLLARHDPPLALHRLRLDGALAEIRADELALTTDEVAALLHAEALTPSEDDARALGRATQGWPAAVRLAALALSGRAGTREITAPAEEGETLVGYLSEQVLDLLPDDVAAFVLDATTSDRVTGPLAASLVGDDGARLLGECVHLAVFLDTDGSVGDDPAYRWQSVFARHVRALRRRTDPARSRDLHTRAARYWAPHDPRSAVEHAVAGSDVDLAARIVIDRSWELMAAGELDTLSDLAGASAASDRHRTDLLLIRAAGAYAGADLATGDALLAWVPRETAAVVPRALVELVAVPARPDDDAVRRASELLAGPVHLDPATRAALLLHLGRARGGTDPDGAAAELLREAERAAATAGLPVIELAAAAERSLAMAASAPGHADLAAVAAVERATRSAHGSASFLAPAHLARGLHAFWRDDLGLARELLTLARDASARDATHAVAAAVLQMTADLQGDGAALSSGVGSGWPTLDTLVHAHRLATKGDLGAAVHTVREMPDGPRLPIVSVWEAEYLRRGGLADAASRALRSAQTPEGGHLAVAAGLTWVLLALDAGRPSDAHRGLELAITRAASIGSIRPFLERAHDLAAPLAAHLTRGTAHEAFVVEVLARAEATGAPRPATPWDLTERERLVLSFLRSSMTAAEIAVSLSITLNTVKTHQRAIYRKLGATGRREALRLAESRGLLTPATGIALG